MPKTAMNTKVESVHTCHQEVVSKVHTREELEKVAVIHLAEVVVAHIKTIITTRTDKMNIISISMVAEVKTNIRKVPPISLVARD